MKYRAEIDGLRALAVIAVIFYHAEMILFGRDWFKGGYIGVDVFFVISGYLITTIILSELFKTGRFSFKKFYERRARRILPMLFTIILVSFPFAWRFLLPSELIEFSQSILSALFFGSNFFFYFATTSYGAESSLLKPLLHTWSLGIEEQFYIVFPILLLVCYRFFRRHLPALLAAMFIVSLVFSEWMAARNPDLNFYLPMSRFWELLAGAMLAYAELTRGRFRAAPASQAFPAIGLCLIACSIFFFNDATRHPGFVTLIPVAGTTLVIAFSSGKDVAGKILGSKPLVGVGLVSYSAYLWHFPIFAFARLRDANPGNDDKLLWIALTFVLSVLSYFLIEQPFRNRTLVPLQTLAVSLTTVFLLATGFPIAALNAQGAPDRFDKIAGMLNYERDNEILRAESWSLADKKRRFDDGPSLKVLVVGNSHSKDTFNAFAQNPSLFERFDFVNFNKGADRSIQISCFDEKNPDNREIARRFFNSDLYKAADIIVVSTRYESDPCRPEKTLRKSADRQGLPYLIDRAGADKKGIIVFGSSPEFGPINNRWIIDDYVLTAEKNGRLDFILSSRERYEDFAARIETTYYERRDRRESVNRYVRQIAAAHGAPYVDKFDIVCEPERKACLALTPDGYKAFYDYGHYTLKGAKMFGERMARHGVAELLQEAAPKDRRAATDGATGDDVITSR